MTKFRALMLGTAAAGFVAASFAAPASAGDRMASSGNDKQKLTVYGIVSNAIKIVDDGDNTDVHFVSDQGTSSRIGLKASAKGSEDLSIGANIALQPTSNGSYSMDQTDENSGGGFAIGERHLNIYFKSNKFGTLSLGQGDTATNGAAEVDLSGLAYTSIFNDHQTYGGDTAFNVETSGVNALSSVTIKDVFNAYDGRSRRDRIRYDTPSFGGAKLSASAEQGGAFHIAGRYSGEFAGIKIAAAVGYDNLSSIGTTDGNNTSGTNDNLESDVTGSISALHSSGLSLTVAGARGELKTGQDRTDDPSNIYVKLGYQANLTDLGKTSFGIDWTQTSNAAEDDQDADAWGVGVTQQLSAYATDLYAGVRVYDVDAAGTNTTDYDDITIATIGARVKF